MYFSKKSLITSTILFTIANTGAFTVTKTWTGATNNVWNVNTNWSPAAVPINGDDLIFPSGAPNQNGNDNLVPGFSSATSLRFQNVGGVAAYSLTGGGSTGLAITSSYTVDANLGTQTQFIFVPLNSGTTIPFTVGTGSTIDFINFISGDSTTGTTVNKLGPGLLIMRSSPTALAGQHTPNFLISAGAVTFSGLSLQEATVPPVSVTNNSTLNFDLNIAPGPCRANISGPGVVNVSGAGLLQFFGTDTYSGLTTINAPSTLQAQANNTFSPNSQHNVLGILDLGLNFPQVIGSLTGNGTVDVGNVVLTTGGDGSSSTFSGTFSAGAGGLTKQGAGIFTISGSSAYVGATTVTAGTLQAGSLTALANASNFIVNSVLDLNNFSSTIGSLAGSGSVTMGSASLTLGGTASTTYSGTITGTGGISKTASGTLTLSGTTTYSGATILSSVAANTLQAGAVNAFSSSSAFSLGASATLDLNNFSQSIGSLAGAGTVSFGSGVLTTGNDNTATAFTGAMSGTGGLTKIGSAVFQLGGSGTKTYSGTTTVSTGTIQTTAANALSATSAHVVNGNLDLNSFSQTILNLSGSGNVLLGSGTLTTGDAATTSFTGAISGNGVLTKQGAGTFILTGPNSYSGGTIVSAGVLQGDTTGIQGNILNNTDVRFDQTTTGTYAGTMTGPGTLTKQNSGTVILTGSNTYTGQTIINGGTLVVNGSTANSIILQLGAGATLKGTGTVGGSGVILGTIEPGNSVGTLTFTTTQSFNPGSTLSIEVSPPAASLMLLTGGDVNISPGSTLQLLVNAGTYAAGSVYPIVRTLTGNVNGTFSNVTNSMPLIAFSVVYLPNEIDLVLALLPFTSIVTRGNAGRVAVCLDQLTSTATGDFANVLSVLRMAPDAATAAEWIDQLQPAVYTDLALAQQNNTFRVRSSVGTRLEQINQRACVLQTKHNHVWFDAYGDWLSQESKKDKVGFAAATGGALLGYDYIFADHFVVGASVAYTYSDLDFHRSRGHGHVQSYYGNVYMGYFQKYFFINALVLGAYNDYEAHRKIQFSTINRKAKATPQGAEVAAHGDTGFLFKFKNFELSPFGMIDYVHLHQNSFTERGAESLDLKVREKNANMLRAEAGLFGAYCVARETWKVRPFAKVSWVREVRFEGKHEKASFVDTNCTFEVTGLYPDRTLVAPGAGLTMYFNQDRIAVDLNYEGEFGNHYMDNKANLQISYGF